MAKLDSLNKDDLKSIAADRGVDVADEDTKDDIISKLEGAGVADTNDLEINDNPPTVEQQAAGLSPTEVAAGTTPIRAMPRNPALDYDDDARG